MCFLQAGGQIKSQKCGIFPRGASLKEEGQQIFDNFSSKKNTFNPNFYISFN